MAAVTYTAHFIIAMGSHILNLDVNRYRIGRTSKIVPLRSGNNWTSRNAGTATNEDRYAANTASDISGYRVLQNTNPTGLGTDYTANVTLDVSEDGSADIEEWSTDAGNMDDVQSRHEVCSATIRSYFTEDNPTDPYEARVICNLYRRRSDGTEDLIATVSQDITLTSTKYTLTFPDFDVGWGTNERLVAKWSCYFSRIIPP